MSVVHASGVTTQNQDQVDALIFGFPCNSMGSYMELRLLGARNAHVMTQREVSETTSPPALRSFTRLEYTLQRQLAFLSLDQMTWDRFRHVGVLMAVGKLPVQKVGRYQDMIIVFLSFSGGHIFGLLSAFLTTTLSQCFGFRFS